ncbi:MAG: LacI family DNA-binding transcriptional regulator [Lachnospiraceae bacterium]|nr:LacI family DNA-binding transcriptional regulator [Lachnospiraceae bacterium]
MNISEFAKLAGVSKSAVSRYFNKGYLSEEKTIQIEKALKKYEYQPSLSAQTVRTKTTKLVGVILPKLSSESCSRVTEGIGQVLGEEGYEILLVNTANDYHKEVKYLELFRQNRVDGVIFLASIFTENHRRVLRKMHIPVVIVGQLYKGFSCICHDDFGAAYSMTKLMLDKGRKRPAFLGVTMDDEAVGKERYRGYMEALAEKNILAEDHQKISVGFQMDDGYQGTKYLFSQKEKPDCLFCATDTIALGAMQYLNEQGFSIPSDVMMAAVGDSKVGKITAVPLTSAHLHYKTSGIEAARMLLAAIRRPDEIPRVLRLDYTVVERASTKGGEEKIQE